MRATSILRRVVDRWQHRAHRDSGHPPSKVTPSSRSCWRWSFWARRRRAPRWLRHVHHRVGGAPEPRVARLIDQDRREQGHRRRPAAGAGHRRATEQPVRMPHPSFTPELQQRDGLHRDHYGGLLEGTAWVPGCTPSRPSAVHAYGDVDVVGQLQHAGDHRHLRPVGTTCTQRRRPAAHSAPWLEQPGGGTVGIPHHPAAEVAVEDASNNIVTERLLLGHVAEHSGPGTFSNTCFGAESYGIVQFSGCSLERRPGTYSITAVDSNPGVTATSGVHRDGELRRPPAKLVFTSRLCPAYRVEQAEPRVRSRSPRRTPSATRPRRHARRSPSARAPPGATFSASPGTVLPVPTSVTIPGGQSSATFYYGDTVAGSPTVTASARSGAWHPDRDDQCRERPASSPSPRAPSPRPNSGAITLRSRWPSRTNYGNPTTNAVERRSH